MSGIQELILIGLPETGKTTFLAALWHVLCSGELQSSLRLERHHDDHGYLNAIRERWANAEIQSRTSPNAESQVSMIVTGEDTQGEVEIRVPDLSGESYESMWNFRKIDHARGQAIARAEGVMLFVHPDRVTCETLISQAEDCVDELDEGDEEDGEAELVEWDPQKSPTQVQLVDVLQSVAALNPRRPLPLAVVVSAWDRVDRSKSPSEWACEAMPLLWQFIQCNPDMFCVRLFGVSAQGGPLPADADRLRDLDAPSDRISVVSEDTDAGADITVPLRWLMAARDDA